MQNLMTTLAQYKNTIAGLAKSLGLSPADVSKLWYKVLQELKSNNISRLSVETDSILDTIEKLSNLDSINETSDTGEVSKLYKKIEEAAQSASSTDDYWNESVQEAIDYFSKNLTKNDNSDIDTSGYKLTGLKNADAGLSFINTPWVYPNINNDEKNYDTIRGLDAVLSVLTNDNYLQFTREQNPDNWLRLIMPMNSHHVEIEDLDRNFWVIAIVIGAISSYLWDENGEIPNMLKKLFDEITQLWENIAYLWLDLAMSTQNKSGDIHIEVVPLPNNSLNNYRKFDNFDVNGIPSINDVQNRIDYLKDLYSEQDLLIIPLVRSHNYQKNWYSKEYYPYIFFFSRATNSWYSRSLRGENNSSLCFSLGPSEEEDMGFTISERLGAARENELDYSYCSPFTEVEDYEDDGKRFYGLLRIVPEISAESYGNGVKINDLNFNLYDAARGIYQSANSFLGTIGLSNPVIIDITEVMSDPIYVCRRPTDIINWNPAPNVPITTVRTDDNKYYMGELISWYGKTQEPQFKNAEFTVVKIGDFLPKDPSAYEGLNDIANIHTVLDYVEENGTKYDWKTYGVGAFKYTHSASSVEQPYGPDYRLEFLNYCHIDHDKNNSYSTGVYPKWMNGNDITPVMLSSISCQRIKNLVKKGDLSSYSGLYVTKIGISFWTGDDGPQWSSGLVCNLIYYDENEQEAYDMGFVGLLDGYWTGAIEVFSYYEGNRWRRLELRADKVLIKTVENKKTFQMTGGQLGWFDHNKEIYYSQYPSILERPHADMSLQENASGKLYLSFSGHTNPISSNTKMTPFINIPGDNENIFGVTDTQIYVNNTLGVLPWESGTYDSTDMNLATARNLNSYLQT